LSLDGAGSDRLLRHLYRRLYSEKRFYESMVPVEYVRLRDVLEGLVEPRVRLQGGGFHELRVEEARVLGERLPWYLHWFVKLPWVFSYSRSSGYGVYRLVGPDRWAARALNYLFTGELGGEMWEVKGWEIGRLLRSYKSLIIVLLNIRL